MELGKVANPVRRQLNRENECFPVPVRAADFGLARWVRPSRPASAHLFSTLRLNVVLTRGILPDFRYGVHIIYGQPPSGQSRVNRVTQMRTDAVPCRKSAGTGPVVLKVVSVTDASFSGVTMNQFLCAYLFPSRPLMECSTYSSVDDGILVLLVLMLVLMYDTESTGGGCWGTV